MGARTKPPFVEHRNGSSAHLAAAALYFLAFCSGMAALIYELAWAKMLSLTFGSTTLSAAAVIAGFMGGMGLGASLYHVVGDRLKRPLLGYGLIELGIALAAAALTPLLYKLPEIFATIASNLSAGPLRVVQFASVFVLVLIPCALMGATFPALCSVMIRSAATVDRRLGWIYGINTIGGAAGVLLGGLVLIEHLGLTRTVLAANSLNIFVGLAAIALLRSRLGLVVEKTTVEQDAILTELPRFLTGAVLLISGFTTLGYEILWFRALRFVVGNSTHALGTVLIVFLAGLGLGSLFLRRAAARNPERNLAVCQLGIAALAVWAVVCEALILAHPAVQGHVSIFLPDVRLQPWGWRMLIVALVSIGTMLPATILMGLSFPLAARLFLGDVRKLGTRVGSAYLLANIGSILGAIVGAAALVPAFGVTHGTRLLAGVNVAIGLVVLLRARGPLGAKALAAGVPLAAAVLLSIALPGAIGLVGEGAPGRLIFSKDADQGTVHVFSEPADPTQRVMLVDGCKIGCAYGYRQTPMYLKQTMLAHLPMMLDESIQRTLNVGLGSGSTLFTLARYPTIASLDCVEINPAVVEGSHFFPERTIYDDPRVRVVVDDAVSFLLRSTERYDLIISDGKQDPFFSGNATLLSREYYAYARDSLDEDGIFIQWISMSTLAGDFQIILRTIADVFSEVEVFLYAPDNAFMLASRRPIFGRDGLSDADVEGLDTFRDLRPFGIGTRAALLGRWVAGARQYGGLVAAAPLSTWDHLVLDYSPFKADPKAWSVSTLENLRLLNAAAQLPSAISADVSQDRNLFAQSQSILRMALVESLGGNVQEGYRLAQIAGQTNPADAQARQIERMLAQQLLQQRGR